MFFADMLDELGFIAREAGTSDIRTVLREFRPDLIVLGPLGGTLEAQAFLKTLQAQGYGGTVMLFGGGRSSEALIRSQRVTVTKHLVYLIFQQTRWLGVPHGVPP